jgi:YD repeat-containing protein
LLDDSTLDIADPSNYTYSQPDGRSMQINQPAGLQSLRDANGNQITIGPGGLTHSSGKSVVFLRDVFNRITRITDPAGNTLNYTYNIAGDLTSFIDQEANTTTYLYNNTHGLLEIRDPRGIQPVRNEYDDSGRLVRTIDAFGQAITFTHNTSARQEVITDRLGNVTIEEYDAAGNVVRITDALGNVKTRTYDARNNVLSERIHLQRA